MPLPRLPPSPPLPIPWVRPWLSVATQAVQERAARELEAAHERARRSEEQLGALDATFVQTGAAEANRLVLHRSNTPLSPDSAHDDANHGKKSDVLKNAADAATQRLWECQAQLSEARRSNALLQVRMVATLHGLALLVPLRLPASSWIACPMHLRYRCPQAELATTCDEFERRVAASVRSSLRQERQKLASGQRSQVQKHVQRALAKATLDRERMLVRVRAEMAQAAQLPQQPHAPDSSDVMMI